MTTSSSAPTPGAGTQDRRSGPAADGDARTPSIVVVPGVSATVEGLDLGAIAQALGAVEAREYRDLAAREASEILVQISRLRSALAATENHAIRALDAALRADDALHADGAREGGGVPEAGCVPEARRGAVTSHHVSLACRISPAAASRRVAAARRLVEDMPRVHGALAAGRIPEEAASAIGAAVGPIGAAERPRVDRVIAEHLGHLECASAAQWRREIELIAHRLDPAKHVSRHRAAHRERHVTIRAGEYGMGRVSAVIGALDAAALRKKLSLQAESLRSAGDRRGHQQIMADLFADTLLGREGGMDPIGLEVGVIISDRVLLAGEKGSATIEGYGVIPADVAREAIAAASGSGEKDGAPPGDDRLSRRGEEARATIRRLYTSPATGELVAMESRARAFPPALARMIRMRTVTCAGPYCGAPIRHVDHIRGVARGGGTTWENGQGLCARCNWMKEIVAAVRMLDRAPGAGEPRRVRWTSTLGVTATRTDTPLQGRWDDTPDDPSRLDGRDRRVEHDDDARWGRRRGRRPRVRSRRSAPPRGQGTAPPAGRTSSSPMEQALQDLIIRQRIADLERALRVDISWQRS